MWGVRMIIDLDSWEVGYGDGHVGRPFECPVNRDQVSYASGYSQGRSARGEARKQTRVRPSVLGRRRLPAR
jgi:hypothetical protein